MSFNVTELVKIRRATSGSEKSKQYLANYIREFQIKLDEIDQLEPELRKKGLIRLMNEESGKRKKAIANGSKSYADPNWAASSSCETLTHCLLGENEQEIHEAKIVIQELMDTNRPPESEKSNKLGFLVVLAGGPLTFYFLNWWMGLIVVFIGLVIIGWKNRYD